MTQVKETFTLYNSVTCPFGMRAWLACELKQISYNTIWCSLSNKSKQFTETYKKALGNDPNSTGRVPILNHNGKYLAESAIVCRYLDYVIPNEAFFPTNPIKKAQVELGIQSTSQLSSYYARLVTSKKNGLDEKVNNLKSMFKKLNEILLESSKNGPFLCDNQITLFEVINYPFVDRCQILYNLHKEKNDLKMSNLLKGNDRLKLWYQKLESHSAVQRIYKQMKQRVKLDYKEYWNQFYPEYVKS